MNLREMQQTAGATFADGDTAEVLHFGDPRAEYTAARTTTALFDLNDRTQIELTGADRASLLHNFCTNDVKKLETGSGCEAFVTNIKGRILAHVFVFATEHALWIDTVPGAEESLLAHLDRYLITEDVELHARTNECGDLLLSGVQAGGVLNSLGCDVSNLGTCDHAVNQISGIEVAARRVDLTGVPGYMLSTSREQLAQLWSHVAEAGATPAGSAAFHALRIEAGMPFYGLDLSEENLAQEAARNAPAISFTKGCYLGQEPIARIDALGHVNRELRGLKLTAGPVPKPGSTVLTADESQEIGHVTSSAMSYADDRPVALALLRSNWTTRDTQIAVKGDQETVPATVFWPSP
jgi:hypothetical protein